MSLFFNEFDPFACEWLRQLMADGHLPHGVVDARSIADISAAEVVEHRRCHWFAGIAGWELALQLAGWPRERSVWTGSCPCQPYSSAGKRKGNADERDLWPTFARLIRECRPPVCFGEQVSSAIRFGWIDRVRRDLEAEGYAVGFAVLGAHSVQAPHQRQRLYWVAHDQEQRFAQRAADAGRVPSGVRAEGLGCGPADDCAVGSVGDTDEGRRAEGDAVPRRTATGAGVPVPTCAVADTDGGFAGHRGVQPGGQHGQQPEDGGVARGMADAGRDRLRAGGLGAADGAARGVQGADGQRQRVRADVGASGGAEPVWDHWRDAITIECRDGKRRRVPAEPALFPLAHGISAGLVGVWKACVLEGAKEVMRYAEATQTNYAEALRMVRNHHGAEAVSERRSGMRDELPATAFLFDYLLDVEAACNGAAVGGCLAQAGAQVGRESVRGVRGGNAVRRSPRGRRSDEQRSGQPSNSVPELSRVLARSARALWEKAVAENAQAVPLSQWQTNRVGLLRGAGNAICVQTAALFVRAFLESEGGVSQ